jgi:hypothetical protein
MSEDSRSCKVEGTVGDIAGGRKDPGSRQRPRGDRHSAEPVRPGQGCSARSYGCRRQLRQRRFSMSLSPCCRFHPAEVNIRIGQSSAAHAAFALRL